MYDLNQENRDTYYYLWHLVSLGVLLPDEDAPVLADTAWDILSCNNCTQPSKVVLIDVGCHFDHPNLKGRVNRDASIDFSGSRFGVRFAQKDGRPAEATVSNFSGLDLSGLILDLSSEEQALLNEIAAELAATPGSLRHQGDVERLFSSHGTAVSGLIVGGPEGLGPDETPSKGVIPYLGVDPCSSLISIRTGFDDDPLQFLSALLYAWHQAPDVIALPRGLPDPDLSYMKPKDDFSADLELFANRDNDDLLKRIHKQEKRGKKHQPWEPHRAASHRRLWPIVRALFVAISKKVPVVCAAGNDGESQLNYPANLADRGNGIIAVGAVNSDGLRSGYSNYGEGLSLVAPSDDMEVFNANQIRDRAKIREKLGDLTGDLPQFDFSPQSLLTTDIPGAGGYDSGLPRYDDALDPGSTDSQSGLYTSFGGTSGAAALVAGVIALIRRAERGSASEGGSTVRDGQDIKELLAQTARDNLPSFNGAKTLRGDPMNSAAEDLDTFATFFGSGLIDAHAAIRAVMS